MRKAKKMKPWTGWQVVGAGGTPIGCPHRNRRIAEAEATRWRTWGIKTCRAVPVRASPNPPRGGREPSVGSKHWIDEIAADRDAERRQRLWDGFYAAALNGMLSSAPMCDRLAVNKSVWCRVAAEWADAMAAERTARHTIRRSKGARRGKAT